MEKKRGLAVLTLFLTCILPFFSYSSGFAQNGEVNSAAYQKAVQMMDRLSPEERVGQLFLVTFDGQDISPESPINDLITNYHIGGVMLKKANDNFSGPEGTTEFAYTLISGLQNIEWQARSNLIEVNGEKAFNDFIPLYIGISQVGDLYPYDQIINGLTPIPSQMAIGASWNTALAEKAGDILGEELSALGFNLFFGPSLDVLDITYNEGGDDLGVRTFGGDPYWVGEMGKAYIKGLHAGSSNRLSIIAKNFPGRGSSDRLPDEEFATVRKSLEQLKLIELTPFFEVTDLEETEEDSITDGLLLSHIRYQGFQGNIRATTKPVSFDQTAVDLLMNLTEFSSWREQGGLLVSEDLGTEAVEKFYSPSGQSFDARQVARSAFLAGNDLLYMDQFVSTGDEDRFDTYRKTIELFVQKYREDQAFAAKVDASVLRILTQKYSLYSEFELEQVIPSENGLGNLGNQTDVAFEIASASVSLISPEIDQLNSTLTEIPIIGDRLIIFTDTVSSSQCTECESQNILAVDDLEKAILKLYGPNGSGQVAFNQFTSYSFEDLQDYVDNPFNRVELETNLSRADWAIFVVQDIDSERAGSSALQNLLSEKSSTIRNKNVVVFSMNAPYYYDATDISAFTAYYGLYSKLPGFIEVAARILFQEISPQGNSPVSIPGVAYELITIMTPDPDQIIELMVDDDGESQVSEISQNETVEEGNEVVYNLGDNLPVRTGVIVDYNGHPVPDGTVVKFILNQQGENVTVQQVETTTINGIARASIILQSAGMHEIRVTSEPALNSQILVLNISEEEGALISAITPTPLPTLSQEETLAVPEQNMELLPEIPVQENNKLVEWLLTTIFAWGSGFLFFFNTSNFEKFRNRAIISAGVIAGGMLAAFWMILGLPGSIQRFGFSGYVNLIMITLLGEIMVGVITFVYARQTDGSKPPDN